jgi:hypothetical protein
MTSITLIVIPGPGARSVNIVDGMSIEQLIVQENLHGRDIIVNGQGILPASFATTTLVANSEVFATGSVKGNGNNSPANGPSQTGRPSGGGRGNNPSKR